MTRIADLERELQYYKELYEVEKETNELNEMKIKELDLMNAQDKQKFEMERTKMRSEIRRLEMEKDRRKDDDSASVLLRQRVHQLEREVQGLSERVRIAENMATKLEDTCRAKDFEYAELQKDYDLCLARCNALELQLMSVSQSFDSNSLSSSVLSLNNNINQSETPKKGNGRISRTHSRTSEHKCEDLQENGHPTPVPSPPVPSSSSSTASQQEENVNPASEKFAQLKSQLLKKLANSEPDTLPVLKDIDVNMARSYCESHPDDMDALLRLADLIRAVRTSKTPTPSSAERRSAPSPSRIPRAVQLGMDSLKDLQRRFSELTRPSA